MPPKCTQVLEREQLDRLWQLLSQTCLADHLVLVGSAAVYRTHSSLPPLTSDADYAVFQSLLRQHLDEFLAQLHGLGFERVADTSTFVHPEGFSFDLLAIDAPGLGDRVADFSHFSAMVFEDLCQVAAEPGAIRVGPARDRVLSAPALVLSKLRTWRREKGIKQAPGSGAGGRVGPIRGVPGPVQAYGRSLVRRGLAGPPG